VENFNLCTIVLALKRDAINQASLLGIATKALRERGNPKETRTKLICGHESVGSGDPLILENAVAHLPSISDDIDHSREAAKARRESRHPPLRGVRGRSAARGRRGSIAGDRKALRGGKYD